MKAIQIETQGRQLNKEYFNNQLIIAKITDEIYLELNKYTDQKHIELKSQKV